MTKLKLTFVCAVTFSSLIVGCATSSYRPASANLNMVGAQPPADTTVYHRDDDVMYTVTLPDPAPLNN